MTRPSSVGVNMPATIVTPCRSAIPSTAAAHGPSSGSAISVRLRPKQRIVASGKTTRSAPSAAAAAVWSATSRRLSCGSGPLTI